MRDIKSVTVTVKVPTVEEKTEEKKEPKHWITEWFYNSWCTYEAEGRNKMKWMRCNAQSPIAKTIVYNTAKG